MEKNIDKSLSIQVSLNGLSFCIYNKKNNTVETLYSTDFESKLSPFDTENRLKSEFENKSEFIDAFDEVNIIHDNSYVTIVPNDIYDEAQKADYLKFNTKILSTDFIATDDCSCINTKAVYIPYININNYLLDSFDSINYYHFATPFVQSVMLKKSRENEVFANVNSHQFHLLVIKENRFIFYNVFEYSSNEDFLYYLLFTLEQLKMNNDELHINISGTLKKESELYELIYTYIRHVNFFETPKDLIFNENIDDSEISKNNILLHSLS